MSIYISFCSVVCMCTGHVYIINSDMCIYEWSMLVHACNDMHMCVHICICQCMYVVCVCVLSFFKVCFVLQIGQATLPISRMLSFCCWCCFYKNRIHGRHVDLFGIADDTLAEEKNNVFL